MSKSLAGGLSLYFDLLDLFEYIDKSMLLFKAPPLFYVVSGYKVTIGFGLILVAVFLTAFFGLRGLVSVEKSRTLLLSLPGFLL